jgi:hypothetical protein
MIEGARVHPSRRGQEAAPQDEVNARRCGEKLCSLTGTLGFPPRWDDVARVASLNQTNEGIAMLMGALITFLVVILILYLINLLPLDGRAKQIARVVVIILGVISLLKYIAVF